MRTLQWNVSTIIAIVINCQNDQSKHMWQKWFYSNWSHNGSSPVADAQLLQFEMIRTCPDIMMDENRWNLSHIALLKDEILSNIMKQNIT